MMGTKGKYLFVIFLVIGLLLIAGTNVLRSSQIESEFRSQFVEVYGSESINAKQMIERLSSPEVSETISKLRIYLESEGSLLSKSKYNKLDSILQDLESLRDIEKDWSDMTVDERMECELLLAGPTVFKVTN